MKRHASILIGLLTISLSAVAAKGASDVAALSYQASTGMKFTFNPTLNLTVSSGDLIISGLAPGNSADSNEITVTIGTNASHGYALYATAGNNSYAGSSNFAANDLVLTNGGSVDTTQTNKFTSLATDASVASMSSANPNTWGYAYATYNTTGSTWNSYSNYSGLPVYTAATGAELLSTNDAADNQSVKFKIGANADDTQASGDYTNVINFYAVANPEPDNTMQGFAAGLGSTTCSAMSTGDTLTLEDSRDGTSYTIGKLADGNCWMLDNLALDLTNDTILNGLTADNTDIDTTNDPGALVALKGTTLGTTSDKYATVKVANWTSGYSYSAPLVNLTDKNAVPSDATSTAGGWKVGGYYNFCAATAGSYCYGDGTNAGSPTGNATSSICPKGWRLPTGKTAGEYKTLYNNTSYNTYADYRSALHLPLSGYYDNGSASAQSDNGYWWSATNNGNTDMYYLYTNTSVIYPDISNNRYYGYSIRCIIDS